MVYDDEREGNGRKIFGDVVHVMIPSSANLCITVAVHSIVSPVPRSRSYPSTIADKRTLLPRAHSRYEIPAPTRCSSLPDNIPYTCACKENVFMYVLMQHSLTINNHAVANLACYMVSYYAATMNPEADAYCETGNNHVRVTSGCL